MKYKCRLSYNAEREKIKKEHGKGKRMRLGMHRSGMQRKKNGKDRREINTLKKNSMVKK